MIEKIYKYSTKNEKAVEKLIMDDNVNYIHMVFNKDEGLPQHYSNSNVYMNVIRGILSIGLDDQEIHEYDKGTLISIPYNTKMNVNNFHDDTLELIVVKAPAPHKYEEDN
ncbi:MAG: cupin domain-containing protein [Eubacteriales bacterium]